MSSTKKLNITAADSAARISAYMLPRVQPSGEESQKHEDLASHTWNMRKHELSSNLIMELNSISKKAGSRLP